MAGVRAAVSTESAENLDDAASEGGFRGLAPGSVARFASLVDHLVAVEPDSDAIRARDDARGDALPASRTIGQVPISWDPDRDVAVARAHEQVRWFAGGWKVNADLPTTEAFDVASRFVRQDQLLSTAAGPLLDKLRTADPTPTERTSTWL